MSARLPVCRTHRNLGVFVAHGTEDVTLRDLMAVFAGRSPVKDTNFSGGIVKPGQQTSRHIAFSRLHRVRRNHHGSRGDEVGKKIDRRRLHPTEGPREREESPVGERERRGAVIDAIQSCKGGCLNERGPSIRGVACTGLGKREERRRHQLPEPASPAPRPKRQDQEDPPQPGARV